MRLLVVAPYPPTPPLAGGRRRILEELRALGRANEVDLACLTYSNADDVRLAHLNLPTVKVVSVCAQRGHSPREPLPGRPHLVESFWNSRLMERIAALADRRRYDWVIAEHSYTSVYLEGLTARKMLTAHNIEYRLFEQIASHDGDLNQAFFLAGEPGGLFRDALEQLPILREFEQDVWKRMDLCVTVSEVERQIMAEVSGEHILHVAPNCPGLPIRATSLRPGPPSIVFVGALNYFPNVDAVIYLVEAILPHVGRVWPGVDVVIAGRDPEPQFIDYCRRSNLRVLPNPASIDDVMTSGSVLVCPLRFGAGTRIKVLDAMATGVPVVGTGLAVEGLGVGTGCGALIADSPCDFSDLLSELLGSNSLRAQLGEEGRQSLRLRNLSWPMVFANLALRLEASVP